MRMSRRHVVQILQGLVLLSFLLLVSAVDRHVIVGFEALGTIHVYQTFNFSLLAGSFQSLSAGASLQVSVNDNMLGETNVRLLDSFKLQLPQNSWPSDVAENPLLMAIDSASLQQIPAGCKPFGPVWLISPAIGLKASAVVNLPLINSSSLNLLLAPFMLLNRSSEWQRIGVWQNQSSSAVSTTADALGVFGVFSIDSQVVISANPQDSTSNSQAALVAWMVVSSIAGAMMLVTIGYIGYYKMKRGGGGGGGGGGLDKVGMPYDSARGGGNGAGFHSIGDPRAEQLNSVRIESEETEEGEEAGRLSEGEEIQRSLPEEDRQEREKEKRSRGRKEERKKEERERKKEERERKKEERERKKEERERKKEERERKKREEREREEREREEREREEREREERERKARQEEEEEEEEEGRSSEPSEIEGESSDDEKKAEGSSDTSESYRQSEEEEEDDEERKTDSAERVMKDKRKKEEQEQEEEEDRKGRNDDSDDKEEEEEEDGWVNDQSKDQKASASQRSESDDSSSPPSTDRVSSRRSLEGEKEEEGEKEKGEEGGGGKREGDSNGSPAVSAEGERRGEGGGGLDSSFNESSLLEPAAVNMTRQPSPHTLEIESTLTRLRKTRESALNFQSRTRQDLSRAHQGHLGR